MHISKFICTFAAELVIFDYLPYGQLLANQQATGYDERFKFTGKERDCETGKGDNSIAQQISQLIPEATIIAPTEEVKAAVEDDRAWVIGVAKNEASTLDEMKKPENFGQWRVFRNGEQIGTSVNGTIGFIYKEEY